MIATFKRWWCRTFHGGSFPLDGCQWCADCGRKLECHPLYEDIYGMEVESQ
jgi:hypothetical protein